MKKALVLLSLFAASIASAQEGARSGKTFFQVYTEPNCKGHSVRVEAPCELSNGAKLKDLGIKKDTIMSMKIPEGVVVTLFSGPGFTGPRAEFTGKAADLGDLAGRATSLKAELKK